MFVNAVWQRLIFLSIWSLLSLVEKSLQTCFSWLLLGSGGSRGGARGTRPLPLIFRPNWGPMGGKTFFGRPLLISGSGWPPLPPLIWRSGSATARCPVRHSPDFHRGVYIRCSVLWPRCQDPAWPSRPAAEKRWSKNMNRFTCSECKRDKQYF